MTDKKKHLVHVNGEFQLDKKALGIDESGFIGMAIDAIIKFLNNLDLNNDQISDVAQAAPIVIKYAPKIIAAYPVLQKLFPLLSPEGFVAWLQSHPEWFKNAEAAGKVIDELKPHIEQLGKAAEEFAALAPKP